MNKAFEEWLESCPVDCEFLEYGQKLVNPRNLLSGFVEDFTVQVFKFYPIEDVDDE